MKKSFRFISLILAAIFLISGSMMIICHAVGDDEAPADGEVSGEVGGDNSDGGEVSGEVGGDNSDGDNNNNNDSHTGNDSDSHTGNDSGDSHTGNDNGEQHSGDNAGYSGDEHSGSNSEEGGSVQNEEGGSGSGYSYVDEDPIYYGDASNYSYNIPDGNEAAAGSVSSQTTLYNSSGMSAADAAPNEWSDIVLDEKTVRTGVSDFSSIKQNTETQDNGDWILYLGYALLLLSVLGILYFIIATAVHRKAVQKAERLERRRASSPARSEAARMQERERRAYETPRRTSHYADEAPSYSRRASSKADTGEVYVPRRAARKSR